MTTPCSSNAPKPSQVHFRPTATTVPQKKPDARILNIRVFGPYNEDACERAILVWAASAPYADNLPTSPYTCLTSSGSQHLLAGEESVMMHWKHIRHDDVMKEMCNILTTELTSHPDTPLEFYTHSLTFASEFRYIFHNVENVSWACNYPTDIRPADDLCITFGRRVLEAHAQHAELGRSWTRYEYNKLTGHAAVPEHWRKASEVLHIAVDASTNRHNHGASAFVTSLGDYRTESTRGPILGCELTAIAQAVHFARNTCGRVVIWSDSRLALNQIARMREEGTSYLPQRFHKPLLQIQSELRTRQARGNDDIVFRWIKAHTDCSSLQRILNDGADRLARHTMRNVSDAAFSDGLATVCQDIVADCMQNLAHLEPCTHPEIEEDVMSEHYDSAHDINSGS